MTIEQKALELVGAHGGCYGPALEAAIEAHEADKARHAADMREQAERFSEAVRAYTRFDATKGAYNHLCSFILPAADPLVEALTEMGTVDPTYAANSLKAVLADRGYDLAIVKKEAVNG